MKISHSHAFCVNVKNIRQRDGEGLWRTLFLEYPEPFQFLQTPDLLNEFYAKPSQQNNETCYVVSNHFYQLDYI